jgi:hypothetical protein
MGDTRKCMRLSSIDFNSMIGQDALTLKLPTHLAVTLARHSTVRNLTLRS